MESLRIPGSIRRVQDELLESWLYVIVVRAEITTRLTIHRAAVYRSAMNGSGLLREQTYYLLAALLDEPLHGYAIAARVNALTDGRLRLAAGTLYGALDRLLDRQLVRVAREEVVAGRERKLYELTDRGEAILVENAQRFQTAARVVMIRRHVPLVEGAS